MRKILTVRTLVLKCSAIRKKIAFLAGKWKLSPNLVIHYIKTPNFMESGGTVLLG